MRSNNEVLIAKTFEACRSQQRHVRMNLTIDHEKSVKRKREIEGVLEDKTMGGQRHGEIR